MSTILHKKKNKQKKKKKKKKKNAVNDPVYCENNFNFYQRSYEIVCIWAGSSVEVLSNIRKMRRFIYAYACAKVIRVFALYSHIL